MMEDYTMTFFSNCTYTLNKESEKVVLRYYYYYYFVCRRQKTWRGGI